MSCLYFTREGVGQEVEPTPCDNWSCVISCKPWLCHLRLDTTVPWTRSRTERRERDHPYGIAVTALNCIAVVFWDTVRDCRNLSYSVRFKHSIYPERTLLQCHLFTTNLTWTDLGSNQVFRGERPATNRLNHGTARLPGNVCLFVCFVSFCLLFVCKCVLYYCHRVATQLLLTNISYHIYRIVSCHVIYIISCHVIYHIYIYIYILYIISYVIYHIIYIS